MFQFPGFAPSHDGTGSSIQWVAPFGNARINSCLQIPAPYRSLPRPSSPPDSLGILRSLLSSFSFTPFEILSACGLGMTQMSPRAKREGLFRLCESHMLLCLLLPIEIVVRKFRFFARLFLNLRVRLVLRSSQPIGCSGPRTAPSLILRKMHRKLDNFIRLTLSFALPLNLFSQSCQ